MCEHLIIYKKGSEYEQSIEFETFQSESELISFINDNARNVGFEVLYAGWVNHKYEVKAVETIIKYELEMV